MVAAGRLLDAHGPEAVTLRAVARQAGIAAPSIYAHFDGPEAILAEVVQLSFGALIADIERARDRHHDPVDRLRAGCAAYLAFAERRPPRYNLMFRGAAGKEPGYGAPGDQGAVAFGLLVDGIAACVRAGRSSSVDPFTDAAALWGGLHGYGTLRDGHRDFPWPPEPVIVDRLITGLARITDPPA